MRAGWFDAWAHSFAEEGVEVAVVGDDTPEAVAPIVREGRGRRAPVNEHSPAYAPVARDERSAGLLARALMEEAPAGIELLKTDEFTSRIWKTEGDRLRHLVHAEVVQRSPFLTVPGDWETYEKSMSSSFRQGLRRKKRRLSEAGHVAIEVRDGRDDLDATLSEGFAVESSQWKAESGTAIASDPRTVSFYTAVARWAAEWDWLRLVFLRLDGTAIAFRLDLVCDGAYFHVKGGYDPEWARFSPGLILQHETVRHAFEAGLDRYEFLGADEAYKLNWTKTVRERYALRSFAPTVRGRMAWASRAWGRPALRRARSAIMRTKS
jgi:CelD/BcsL family acetyltransferase involved in cellulose biosynthesis